MLPAAQGEGQAIQKQSEGGEPAGSRDCNPAAKETSAKVDQVGFGKPEACHNPGVFLEIL
jgi:hypothetical protein